MEIIYDNIIFAIQQFGGISVVWEELPSRITPAKCTEFVDIDVSKTYNHNRSKLNIPEKDIIRTIKIPRISRYLPVRISKEEPFIFHSSYYRYCTNKNAINITTVHDFTYELFRSGLRQKMHTWQKYAAIRHSAAVVCISENTKKDLMRLMPDVQESKIHVIYNGVSDVYHKLLTQPEPEELPFPAGSYVVFIGRRDEYKNFWLTANAVAHTHWNLLIIGSQLTPGEQKKMQAIMPASQYKCLSRVSDENLNLYYNHAAALVYPSSYEGFGLPVLEAQRSCCPVIAYNASSIPEIIGETPLLMKELTEKELADKLSLLNNTELINSVKSEGIKNSNKFSWERMANDYSALYEDLRRA